MHIIHPGKVKPYREHDINCRYCEAQYLAKEYEAEHINFAPWIIKFQFKCPLCKNLNDMSIVKRDENWFRLEAKQKEIIPKRGYIDTNAM